VVKFTDDGSLEISGGGAVVGTIPQGLPALKAPTIDFGVVAQLLPAAITIALLGFMEAISIAKAMATRTKQRVDANQELIGQGLGNIVGGLFQSYPVSGSFSRSAVNIGAGAVTGFSSVVTSLIVVIVLLWLTPLLYHLPQATLAAVIMMAVFGLINVGIFKHIWKTQRSDGMVAVITFFLTLMLAPHLDYGILIGAAMALGLYLLRTMHPRVAVLGRYWDGTLRDAEYYQLETCPNITMIRFDGSLYFANTSYFEDKVLERSSQKPDLKYVIVDGEGINQIDASGEDMLATMVERLEDIGVKVIFTEFKHQAYDVLKRSGFIDKVGEEHFFRNVERALRHVWQELGDDHVDSCALNPLRQAAQE
jgi:SulP family sulfate permease